MSSRYADKVTEYVAPENLRQYRRNARRFGLVVIMSAPSSTLPGYFVTTASRPEVTR